MAKKKAQTTKPEKSSIIITPTVIKTVNSPDIEGKTSLIHAVEENNSDYYIFTFQDKPGRPFQFSDMSEILNANSYEKSYMESNQFLFSNYFKTYSNEEKYKKFETVENICIIDMMKTCKLLEDPEIDVNVCSCYGKTFFMSFIENYKFIPQNFHIFIKMVKLGLNLKIVHLDLVSCNVKQIRKGFNFCDEENAKLVVHSKGANYKGNVLISPLYQTIVPLVHLIEHIGKTVQEVHEKPSVEEYKIYYLIHVKYTIDMFLSGGYLGFPSNLLPNPYTRDSYGYNAFDMNKKYGLPFEEMLKDYAKKYDLCLENSF